MKWVFLIGGGTRGLIAMVALIGALLPRHHRATRQARYRQKPEAIYFTLAGPVDWRTDIKASAICPTAMAGNSGGSRIATAIELPTN